MNILETNTSQLSEVFVERQMVLLLSEPGETRTHDQWLKRPLSLKHKSINIYTKGFHKINVLP